MPLSASAQRFQNILREMGFGYTVVELPNSTRTSVEAAQAVGCQVGQIAKSLVFRGKQSGKPVLVIASGANRVDEKRLKELLGEKVEKPDADYVREHTGFAIGGIPPVGHAQPLLTFIDADLLKFEFIWAAAGTPNAVFQLAPADLQKMTGGQIVAVASAQTPSATSHN